MSFHSAVLLHPDFSDLVILYPTLVQLQAAESKVDRLLSGLYGLDFGFGGGRSFSQHAFCP